MPDQYTKIKLTMLKEGKSPKAAKASAARIYIAKGAGGSPSSRAKALAKDK